VTDTTATKTDVALSQLLYTHEKLENLARATLPPNVNDRIRDIAQGLALEMGKTPAHSWDEFHRKLKVLLYDWDDVYEFMDVIQGDIARLALTAPEIEPAAVELAEAAE
jgi:hypothetical protein